MLAAGDLDAGQGLRVIDYISQYLPHEPTTLPEQIYAALIISYFTNVDNTSGFGPDCFSDPKKTLCLSSNQSTFEVKIPDRGYSVGFYMPSVQWFTPQIEQAVLISPERAGLSTLDEEGKLGGNVSYHPLLKNGICQMFENPAVEFLLFPDDGEVAPWQEFCNPSAR